MVLIKIFDKKGPVEFPLFPKYLPMPGLQLNSLQLYGPLISRIMFCFLWFGIVRHGLVMFGLFGYGFNSLYLCTMSTSKLQNSILFEDFSFYF